MHANLDKRARLIEFALEAQGLEAGRAEVALPGAVLTELDFPNIQGFVVRGYRLPAAGYLFLRIDDAAKARAFLGDVIPQVITAERWDVKPESGINLAFSHEGLRALGVAGRPRSPASRPSSATAWPRAPSCSATSARAPRSTGRSASAAATRTCW